MTTTTTGQPVEVRRSARRRRTVSAFWEDGVAVVAIPGHFSASEEREWVQKMVGRLEQKKAKAAQRPGGSATGDRELMDHALELSARYLAGRARPQSIRWVGNQNSRWGSATPATETIRISNKLRGMPQWVVDYVILHELTHLLVASHNARFWQLLEAYPETARAKAFLEGAAFASSRGLTGETGLD
ncbi:MAG TPA: YgjP-like metallopeptidase domain-containing protein [Arthrobacter sp.]|nr:YgjP-like metallopeptidase domain-containing protein [Arthrobacter sp.]